MYYSSGNYEAFARPQKPQDIDTKRAWIVGGGMAGLATAGFLIRDAQMPGPNITILEANANTKEALEASGDAASGWMLRGGREVEDHFECMWDLYRSVPSLEVDGSVLDEFYWLNKENPNRSLNRTTENRGQPGGVDPSFHLGKKGQKDLAKLVMARVEDLYDKRIDDVVSKRFLDSPFWLYWRTLFGFQQWHSALELKLYIQRYVDHLAGLVDLSALKFPRYNQHESLILPLQTWLEDAGVVFRNDTAVVDIDFEITRDHKRARSLTWVHEGKETTVPLTDDDLLFITNGSAAENVRWGDHKHAPKFDTGIHDGGSWALWRNIARQDPAFGNPENFCNNPEDTFWESATLTIKSKKIRKRIEKIAGRKAQADKTVTGGLITIKDSNWLMSWTVDRQGQFPSQPDDQLVAWLYALSPTRDGNFIKKPMTQCTGREIAQEWLWHLGFAEDKIEELSKKKNLVCRPALMPFVTAFFMPRDGTDRPKVVPEDSTNFAFIGQFAETPRDTVFTAEYSVRTAMEAVYQLADVDRGVPEVFGSIYDIRQLLRAAHYIRDRETIELPKQLARVVEGNELGVLFAQYGLVVEELEFPHREGAVPPDFNGQS